MNTGEILFYQNLECSIKIDVRLEDETVWLTRDQMGLLLIKLMRRSGDTNKYRVDGEMNAIRNVNEELNLIKYISDTDLFNVLYNLLNDH